ncbi:transglycosylase domain-containing protein [Paenibacillus turpanensis]|uniref:transglycosylase domain-containing protein n=1 Tax=Paenibacillus turpanensis TaxID=2689078 RepID=UPI00140A4093|nr:transglycosylase domain-containing protein [Paenibacillus turpanensis]
MAETTDKKDRGKKKNSAAPAIKKYGLMLLTVMKWMFVLALLAGFLAAGAVTGYVSALVKDDKVRTKEEILNKMNESTYTGFVYFNDDTVIGQLRTEADHRPAQWNEVPEIVKNAFLATEDDGFYDHPGVDIYGLGRAVMQKVLKEDVQTGGSTITQQLARRVFLNLDRTDSRKFKEIFLALRLERFLSKEEIFVHYMNKIPYGNGSSGYNLYGIKSAAKGIFDLEDMNQLNIAQAAYLAGLPQSPSTYSAFTGRGEFDQEGFDLAKRRQLLVLDRMLETGKITAQQYEEAKAFDLRASLAQPKKKAYDTYPYLMLEAEREAAMRLLQVKNPELTREDLRKPANAEQLKEAREMLLRGGYKIYTTIDKPLYDAMKEIASNPKNFTEDHKTKGVEQIGAVMIDNKTGAILSMMEGRDFYIEQLNHATQMLRQPGSTMKPIAAYLPAIDQGLVSPASVIDDIPVILEDGVKGYHLPRNWDNRYRGLVTAREALDKSLNIPAIRIFLDKVGIEASWDFAKKLGITSLQKEDYQARTGVIGGLKYGVSVEELTNAYAAIANNGVFNDAHFIRKIEDVNGTVVYEHQRKPTTVVSEQSAYLMTDMLKTVITNPGGTAHDLTNKFKNFKNIQIAGKTGSTQDDVDAWFMGYTPDITVGVWAGYDKPATLTKGSGTVRAKNIWALIMDTAIAKKPELFPTKQFTQPNGIVKMTVSSVSGKLPSELVLKNGKTVTDLFNQKYIPTDEDDVLVEAKIVQFEGKSYLPQPGTPADMVMQKLTVKRDPPISELMSQIQSIMEKLPAKNRESVESFRPEDDYPDAPLETDPREDASGAPVPPYGLELKRMVDSVEGTFNFSSSPDVVGYRIYRSTNHGPFERLNGNVVLYGEPNNFVDQAAAGIVYGYYVTAVDVAGRESGPSNAVYTDGRSESLPQNAGSSLDSPFGPIPDSPQDGRSNSETSNDSDEDKGKKPSSPSGLKAENSAMGVRLKWNENEEADEVSQYHVYFSEKSGGPFKRIKTTTTPSYDHITVITEGWYRVSAVNKAGESPLSAPVPFKQNSE